MYINKRAHFITGRREEIVVLLKEYMTINPGLEAWRGPGVDAKVKGAKHFEEKVKHQGACEAIAVVSR